MAVIKDLIVGRDGLVRAATIHTTTGTTSRPITKLYSLELNEVDVNSDESEGPLTQQPTSDTTKSMGTDKCP